MVIKANNQIMNHKPSFPMLQNHETIKNRKAELKKKMMKKSGKTKLLEYEISNSPKNFRKYVPQPGKPPPSTTNSSTTPTKRQHQQQQQQQQQSTCTPNYMKSTSSSVARKEQSQVSSRSPQTYSQSCSRKNSSNSKLGSASSVNKPIRSLLARTPSFKPTRVSSCSPIVMYDDFQVERATCSSTLKEVKFPAYLELSPGGTESDGTSVFKVCPYTYCSLNGHHHPPLPPLKSFLSARRRTLKNQRSFKLGCVSPRRANHRGLSLSDYVPKQIESSTTEKVAPLTNEDEKEFFVEIYSKEKEETNSIDDYYIIDSSVTDLVPSNEGIEVAADDSEDNLDQKREALCPNEGASDMVQEEVEFKSLSMHTEIEIEPTAEELESEASDMDWDVEKYYAYSEDETGSISDDIDPITFVDDSVISEEFTEKSSNPELLSDNTLEEFFDKESIISGTSYAYDDSESICSHTEFDIDECVEVSEGTTLISLDVNFILDGIDSETATMDYQAAVKAEETFCLEDEISTPHEDSVTPQDDDAAALTGYQELNVCYLHEVLDETCKDNEKHLDENIVVKMEETETKTDCCEQGSENSHGDDAQQLVVESDLKDESDKSHQAEDGSENSSGVEADKTGEACVEKQNQIKDNKTHAKYDSSEEMSERYKNLRGIARRNDSKEPEESRDFNPRLPNFLPLEPDPDAEKVDLKHQMIDDRKNAEDWMLDFALRRCSWRLLKQSCQHLNGNLTSGAAHQDSHILDQFKLATDASSRWTSARS
uniref:Calmodulin-binding domain-containing protein n=1 Tax=Solanum lycopersicum TaxID=4081 RepID=A0A3Q7F0E6_SOLLC